LDENAYPQPGYVIARGASVLGHCGILDYDGAWISTGPYQINRRADLQSSTYQPVKIRKYEP